MKISNHLLISEQHDPSITFIKTPNVSTGFSPLFLLVHYTAGTTAEGAVSWFQNKAAQASAHIIIDRNGSIIQMVPFNRRAWHAGKSKWGNLEGLNQYAIGIELVNAISRIEGYENKILILQNHGLIISGQEPGEIESKIEMFENNDLKSFRNIDDKFIYKARTDVKAQLLVLCGILEMNSKLKSYFLSYEVPTYFGMITGYLV